MKKYKYYKRLYVLGDMMTGCDVRCKDYPCWKVTRYLSWTDDDGGRSMDECDEFEE